MKTTYFKGDLAKYTGKILKLYGGTFYEVEIMEGRLLGKLLLVKNPPKN